MSGTGDVLGPQGGAPFERRGPDFNEAVREAGNPGRLNRTSIVPFDSPTYLRPDFLQTRPGAKNLSDFDISLVPADEVKALLKQSSTEVSGTQEEAEKLAFEEKKQKAISDLEESVGKLRSKVFLLRRGMKKLSPGSKKKIRVLEARLTRTKRALRQAKKLQSREQSVSATYGAALPALKSDLRSLSTETAIQVDKLKVELGQARADKKALDKQKAALKTAKTKAKKLQREGQKAIDQQLRHDRNQGRNIQRRQETAGKSKTNTQTPVMVTRTSGAARKTYHNIKPAGTRPVKTPFRIGSGISPVRTATVNMKQFLAGIKPSKGLSVKQIEDRIWGIKTRDDIKQILADMRAAKLDLATHHRLRSLINAGLCGFMRDDRKFETLDSSFVAHVISMGDNREEAIKEFTKAAAHLKAKLLRG